VTELEGGGEAGAPRAEVGGLREAERAELVGDSMGFDQLDRRYLKLIAESFGGGPVGIETIAAGLSEPRDAIEDIIEPYMIQQGFIQRTPRGRVLTATAWKHLGMQPPKDLEAAQFRLFQQDD
jgi:Holliday junction DNA helicase RuvB